jgi:hypothetical protein
MPEDVLDNLDVGLGANQERCEAVAQIVEAKATRVILSQNPGSDCCWSGMVFHQHVSDPRFLALQLPAGKYPVGGLTVSGLLQPPSHEICEQRMHGHWRG